MRSVYTSVCVVLYYYCHCDGDCYLGEIRAAIQGGVGVPEVVGGGGGWNELCYHVKTEIPADD